MIDWRFAPSTCDHLLSFHTTFTLLDITTTSFTNTHAAMSSSAPTQEDTSSLTTKLSSLLATATQHYALKNYSAAAEAYSEAAELQDTLNGEMSPENADLLYQYGRCLYHVAVQNSDVLGGKVASAEEPKRKKRKTKHESGEGASGSTPGKGVIGEAIEGAGKQSEAGEVVKKEDSRGGDAAASKPYFQITGDENWTDSEEDEDADNDDAAADAEAEEEEDDFAIAYEILDVARVLLSRKLETSQSEAPEHRQLKERLADTHDLQAEISLENERFADAVNDTRDSLKLKMEMYPEESSLVAEAHFKLALSLEFASVTSNSNEEGGDGGPQVVDEEMRAEAAREMEKAIQSCNLRVSKEEAALATLTDTAKKTEQHRSITEVKEMVADMQQRLVELRQPPAAMALSSGATDGAGSSGMEGGDELRGMLGAMLGESQGERQRLIKEATEKANDLSGLVKHRKKPKAVAEDGAGAVTNGNGNGAEAGGKGKRKAEDGQENAGGKKVKFEGDGV